MTFGNRSIIMHLGRGALGIAALAVALQGYEAIGWLALVFLPVALWALKGCPVCWTIGLFETLAFKVFGWTGEDDHCPLARADEPTLPSK